MRFSLITLLILLTIGPVLFAFPPQRRSGNWTDHQGRLVAPSFETRRLDRSEYGYLPHFGPLSNLGKQEPLFGLGSSTVSLPDAGPYKHSSTRWVVDWAWVTVVVVFVGLILTAIEGEHRLNVATASRKSSTSSDV